MALIFLVGTLPLVAADYSSRLSALDRQIQQLEMEKDRALAQMRAGKFCSECSRTSDEIERGGESFSEHLSRVKGHPVTRQQLDKKAAEFDARIDQLKRQRDALARQEWEETQRERQAAEQRRQAQERQRLAEAQTERERKYRETQSLANTINDTFERQRQADRDHDRRQDAKLERDAERRREDREEYAREQAIVQQQELVNRSARQAVADEQARQTAAANAIEAQRLAAEARTQAQENQARFAVAKQTFADIVAEFQAASAPPAEPDSLFAGFAGDTIAQSSRTLFDELAGQVVGGNWPNLRDAAKSGINTTVKDVVYDSFSAAYDSVVRQLPTADQTNLRTISLPLTWMTLNPKHIVDSTMDFAEKEVGQPIKAFIIEGYGTK